MHFSENMTSNSSTDWTNQSFLGNSCSRGDDNQSVNTSTVLVFSLLSSLILSISVLANGFLCYLVTCIKHLRTVNNYMVADLAVVNLLNTAINGSLFLWSVAFDADVIQGRLWGFFMFALHIYFSFVTLSTMFMMMMDRYLAIRYPFKHKSLKKRKTVLVAIVVKWCLSLVPILIICGGRLYRIELGGCLAFYYRAAYVKEPIFQIGCYFTGPPLLFTSICLYVMSRRKLKVSDNRLSVPELSNQRVTNLKSERALNTIHLTVMTFVFCYAPSFVIIVGPFNNPGLQLFVVYFLLFIPGAVNPFIYFFRVQCFKEVITEHWHRICCYQKQNPEGSRTQPHSVNVQHTSDIQKLDFDGKDVVELRILSEHGRSDFEDNGQPVVKRPRDDNRRCSSYSGTQAVFVREAMARRCSRP